MVDGLVPASPALQMAPGESVTKNMRLEGEGGREVGRGRRGRENEKGEWERKREKGRVREGGKEQRLGQKDRMSANETRLHNCRYYRK